MQSKKHSLIESLSNIAIGYCISIMSNILIFPLFDIHVQLSTNLKIGGLFTIVSIIRSYFLRRFFNFFTVKLNEKR